MLKKEPKIKLISIVIPAYKQQKTITRDIKKIKTVLATLPYKFEIIVVVDGRLDKTAQILRRYRHDNTFILEYEKNQGKGFAVKHGILKAKGDIVGFIDAGMDLEPSVISLMIDLMQWKKADIVIGSKLHEDSQVNYPPARRVLSWGYRTFTHLLFGFKVRDTQVGLKLFRKKVAAEVFPRILVKRFAFDVEVLALAHVLGYRKIFEAPIKLKFNNSSTITSSNFWKEIGNMLWDTSAVFYRIRILRYYRKSNKKNWLTE